MSPKTIGVLVADYEALIAELEQVIAHARICISHAGNRELARLGAHGFAATGHLLQANDLNAAIAEDWAAHATA